VNRDAARQLNPLLPGYDFHLYLVAGLTPIEQGGPLDFYVDRPGGMRGFIINLTVAGSGRVHDGERHFDCGSGDLLLFPPGVPHYYGRAPQAASWHHRWVYFRPRAFWAGWLRWPTAPGGQVGRLPLADPALRDEMTRLFADIDATHRGGKRTSQELAINLLERLLIRCHEEQPGSDSRPLDARIQAACQLLTDQLARDLSLEQVAAEVCLSPSRLAHLFREQIGVNLLRWREDQRIILAKHMLQSTATPVSAIAARVGYDDPLYFSRVFRKRVGVAPTEFRRSHAEAADPWSETAASDLPDATTDATTVPDPRPVDALD
jgi:AraC family transcriptional regulator of arabinose operon